MKKTIEMKKERNSLNSTYIQTTEQKLDVFLANDRTTIQEHENLINILKN